nr:uroporphyrinogen decarboxylase [Planctomycetota bacterium]
PPFSLEAGRMPVVLEATRKMRAAVGDELALYGLVCGPFTLAMHLAGSELFLAMYDDLDAVADLVMRCAEVSAVAAEAYVEAGADVVAIVDPMVSQIGADHFAQLVTPAVNAVADRVHAKQALASLFVCGDATRNLEAMAQTTCDNISIDENIDLAKLAAIGQQYDVSIGGNLMLTVALLLGSQDDVTRDVLRAYEQGGETGFILAPGCDLPYAVPPENLERVAELAHDSYQRGVAAATLPDPEAADQFDDVQLPSYANEAPVIVDCITLDSLTCPPCRYMVDVAQRAAAKLGGERVVVREHKVTGRDGLGYMTKLGVSNIPTLCVDGAVRHVSLIPSVDALASELEEALACKPSAAN